MIRNIIFDLGNVLISFKPAEYLKEHNYPGDKIDIILKNIFLSSEWLMLDNGTISTKEAIDRIEKKSILKRAEISSVFNQRLEIMFPLNVNTKMLPALRKRGFKLYYLSNFPLDTFYEVKNSYSFFKYFDGGIISAEINYSKPDPAIYNIFLQKYDLMANECLFIDDAEINVKAAESLGMKGYFTDGSEMLNIEDLMPYVQKV